MIIARTTKIQKYTLDVSKLLYKASNFYTQKIGHYG